MDSAIKRLNELKLSVAEVVSDIVHEANIQFSAQGVFLWFFFVNLFFSSSIDVCYKFILGFVQWAWNTGKYKAWNIYGLPIFPMPRALSVVCDIMSNKYKTRSVIVDVLIRKTSISAILLWTTHPWSLSYINSYILSIKCVDPNCKCWEQLKHIIS